MFDDATQATPDPEVIATTLEEEAVLLHMSTQHYYTLNETGCFIWQRLEQGQMLGEIRAAIEERYDVTPEQAARSVTELVAELRQEHLITIPGSPT